MNIGRHSRALAVLAAVGLLAVAACGSDDDSDSDRTTPTTVEAAATTEAASAAPTTAGGATADPVAYCDAHLGLEVAFSAGDPAGIDAAVAAAHEVVPAEISEALDATVANAPTEPGPPDPTFTAAYGQLVDWVRDNCGFNDLSVLATDYQFGGIPDELSAGPTIWDLTNNGTEFHEVALIRKGEGVTESFDELLAMSDEEIGDKAVFLGAAITAPGESGSTVVDLTPGEYIAVCFIPLGTTPEVLAAGPPPDAEPHFTHGMRHEFTVA